MQDCRAELKRKGQLAAMTIVRPWLEARGDDCGLAMESDHILSWAAPKFLESLGLRHSEDFDAQRLIYLC